MESESRSLEWHESVKGGRQVATGPRMETTVESTAPASAEPCPEPLRTIRPVVFTPGALNDNHDNTTRNPPSSGFYAITDSRIPARMLDRNIWLKPLLRPNDRGKTPQESTPFPRMMRRGPFLHLWALLPGRHPLL